MFFKIKLAGVCVAVNSIHKVVFEMCRDYLTDEEAAFTIRISQNDIEFEREKSAREAKAENAPCCAFSDDYLETLAVYRKIAALILKYNVFLMHGAAVAVGDEAFVFTAPSGTGKTTHIDLWLKNIPGAFVVNGDKPLVKIEKDKCLVCGTPWAGKEGMHRNVSVRLSAICILCRGKENRIEQVSFSKVYPLLFGQIYKPTEKQDVMLTLELMKALDKTVRFYVLHCNMEHDAAITAYNGMRSK